LYHDGRLLLLQCCNSKQPGQKMQPLSVSFLHTSFSSDLMRLVFSLVTYCVSCHCFQWCCPPNLLAPSQSKECQTLSWKASHKANCIPNPTVAALNGAKPEKFSTEWVELEIDKLLSKWMAEWRRCFMHWTMLALDLANHPPNRVVTHWYDNPATTPPIR